MYTLVGTDGQTDRQTDGRTDTQNFGGYNIIPRHFLVAGHNKMTWAPSEDSDQPGHPPSLIRVFAVRMKKHWVLSFPITATTLIRLRRCTGRSKSSLGAQVILSVLSYGSSYGIWKLLRSNQTVLNKSFLQGSINFSQCVKLYIFFFVAI